VHKNWLYKTPHWRWQRSIADLITRLVEGRASRTLVWQRVREIPPTEGWTDDAKTYVRLAYEFAVKNRPKDEA
jgi:hypothetical protein